MDSSLFPDGCLADRSQLRRTDTTKRDEILRSRTTLSSGGVISGLGVSVNGATATNIDIQIGTAWCPNGEYLTTTSAYYSILLDDYTLNAINYVCLVQTSSNSGNQPHESDGQTYPTFSETAWRIRVYDATAYAALSATDSNLSNDARDRMIILARVTANGAGNPLTASSIESPTVYNNILYANPSALQTITGVTITAVSSGSNTGTNGSLAMTYAAGPPTYTFTWTGAGGAGAGAPVAVTSDGYYNFTDGLGEYITCLIVVSQLPTSNVSETIEIINLYYQSVPRVTAEDFLHRNYIGSGVISTTNPHGQSLDDFGSASLALLEEHQDVQHCNGIWRDSATTTFACSIHTATPVADTLNVNPPAANDLYYINGNKLNVMVDAAGAPVTGIPFNPWQAAWGNQFESGLFELYLTDTGELTANRKMEYPAWGGRNCRGTWVVDASESYPAGNYNLTITINGAYTTFQWDGGPTIPILSAAFGVGDGRVIRLFDQENIYWIDLWVNVDDAKHAVNDDQVPSGIGPHTDSITVSASPDWDANMQIAALCYWYDGATPKGKLGYAPNEVTRRIIDKRVYGTLCEAEINDNALQNLFYHPRDEFHSSGVLRRRSNNFGEFSVVTTAGLDSTYAGGNYYCRGHRLSAVGDTVTLIDNTTNLVWLDTDGAYQNIDVNATFGGITDAHIVQAMHYVLGSSMYIPEIDDDTHSTDAIDPPERGVLLYLVVTSGGAISYQMNMMRNVNDSLPWTVATMGSVTGGSLNTYSIAEFDNLYASFRYAELALGVDATPILPRESTFIEVSVVGDTTVASRALYQPENVNVKGTIGASGLHTTSTIMIYYVDGSNNTWYLNTGCKVSGLALYAFIDNANILVVQNDNTIEGCECVKNGGVSNVQFIRVYDAAWSGVAVSNIVVRNNRVTLDDYFVGNPNVAATYDLFTIENNVADITPHGGASPVINLTAGSYNKILNNKLVTQDHTYTNYSIVKLADQEDTHVDRNKILVGDDTLAAGYEAGIYIHDSNNCSISNNTIIRQTGSSSTLGMGIRFDNNDDMKICQNTIKDLAIGIFDEDVTHDSARAIISGNQITADLLADYPNVGILFFGNDSIISDNVIRAKSLGIMFGSAVANTNTKVEGNYITVNSVVANPYSVLGGAGGTYNIVAADDANNFSIMDNDLFMTENGGIVMSNSACIYLELNENFTIQGNKTRMAHTGAADNTIFHIFVKDPKSGGTFSIMNNHIDNRTGALTKMGGMWVSDTAGVAGVGTISNNFIDGSNIPADPSNELYVDSAAAGYRIVVKSNTVAALKGAGAFVWPALVQGPAISIDASATGQSFTDGATNTALNSNNQILW